MLEFQCNAPTPIFQHQLRLERDLLVDGEPINYLTTNPSPSRPSRTVTPSKTHKGSASPAPRVSPSGSVVGDAGQNLAPSLEEGTDVRSGALGQEEGAQPTPGTETPERSETSEQPLDSLPYNGNVKSRDQPGGNGEQMRPGRTQTVEEGEQAEEFQEEVEVVEEKSGETTQQENERAQLEGSDPALLPRCYSSPAADPSEGSWRKADEGLAKSPITGTRHIGRFVFFLQCFLAMV